MRFLEGAPARYDRGMQVLTLGGWRRAHATVAELAAPEPGARVLDLGCGTGALAALLLGRGARVVGVDQSPDMLDRARERLADAPPDRLTLEERTASEIDRCEAESFDAVTASLALSEMSAGERAYVLRQVARLLRPGGVLVVADEVTPKSVALRWLHRALRLPLALLTWIVTGTTTSAIPDLAGELAAAGLRVREERSSRLGSFAVVAAERPRS